VPVGFCNRNLATAGRQGAEIEGSVGGCDLVLQRTAAGQVLPARLPMGISSINHACCHWLSA